MASFTRFFILALPPLLGVTSHAGPAFLFALVLLVVMLATQFLAKLLRDKLRGQGFLWALIGQSVVLITVVDLLATLFAPELRAAWGIYLNLLALSPLVLVVPVERRLPLRPVVLLLCLITAMGLVRDVLGFGTLTLIPGALTWKIPFLNEFPLTIFASTAGAFFLASVSIVVYRIVGPWVPSLMREPEDLPERPVAAEPAPVLVERRAATRPSGIDATEWGETLEEVVAKLPSDKMAGKKRLLVIGSGNGELAYYLSMLALESGKTTKGFQFRVRGVDHFSTRVEAAVKGIYRDNLLEFIPETLQDTWLTRGKDDPNLMRVVNEPRLHIQFEVADLHAGQLTFPQSTHLTVINRGVEHASKEKAAGFHRLVCDHLLPGGALILLGSFARETLPEGMKRTGTTVFRKE
ncbi:MAG: CheR family methyltransferase [Spirochaetales bacterium]